MNDTMTALIIGRAEPVETHTAERWCRHRANVRLYFHQATSTWHVGTDTLDAEPYCSPSCLNAGLLLHARAAGDERVSDASYVPVVLADGTTYETTEASEYDEALCAWCGDPLAEPEHWADDPSDDLSWNACLSFAELDSIVARIVTLSRELVSR